jgi:hypothetical protein
MEFEGQCQGCDSLGQVDDIGLCSICAAKMDSDMIRQRAWDYSVTAFGWPVEKREELRKSVLEKYGEPLELIAPQ